jgi:hypothetical protein
MPIVNAAIACLFINDPFPFAINFMQLICNTDWITGAEFDYPCVRQLPDRNAGRGRRQACLVGRDPTVLRRGTAEQRDMAQPAAGPGYRLGASGEPIKDLGTDGHQNRRTPKKRALLRSVFVGAISVADLPRFCRSPAGDDATFA